MKKTDFYVQLVMMTTASSIGFAAAFDLSFVFLLLLLQFIVGLWQFVASLAAVTNRTAPHHHYKRHLTISAFYLILLGMSSLDLRFVQIPELALQLLWTVPAWCLAFYSFYITYQKTFPAPKTGSFLRNISF